MSAWSGLDFFIFFIFLLNILLGMSRGASKEIISFFALCAALIFTIKFTIPLTMLVNSSPLISDVIASSMMQNFITSIGFSPLTQETIFSFGYGISLLICFVGIFSIGEATLSYTNAVNLFTFPYMAIDRKVGASMGAVRGYVFATIFVLFCLAFDNAFTANSYFINLLRGSASQLNTLIIEQTPERYHELLKNKNVYNAQMVLDALKNPQ